jgi:hypothetical protein
VGAENAEVQNSNILRDLCVLCVSTSVLFFFLAIFAPGVFARQAARALPRQATPRIPATRSSPPAIVTLTRPLSARKIFFDSQPLLPQPLAPSVQKSVAAIGQRLCYTCTHRQYCVPRRRVTRPEERVTEKRGRFSDRGVTPPRELNQTTATKSREKTRRRNRTGGNGRNREKSID